MSLGDDPIEAAAIEQLAAVLQEPAECPLGMRPRLEVRVLQAVRSAESSGWELRIVAICAIVLGLAHVPLTLPLLLLPGFVCCGLLGVLYVRLIDSGD
jgi:hypothetical protein